MNFDTMEVWMEKSGTDETRLGIWCWKKLKINNDHTCRVICTYKSVIKVTDNMELKTTIYSQNRRYLHAKLECQCTGQLFRYKLVNTTKFYMNSVEQFTHGCKQKTQKMETLHGDKHFQYE